MRISDWSSDVCSSDLVAARLVQIDQDIFAPLISAAVDQGLRVAGLRHFDQAIARAEAAGDFRNQTAIEGDEVVARAHLLPRRSRAKAFGRGVTPAPAALEIVRSEEHTSELQSLMRNSYAV